MSETSNIIGLVSRSLIKMVQDGKVWRHVDAQ